MEAALYYPGLGYYNSGDEKIGKTGDFYTAANVTDLFGRIIADRIRAIFDELNSEELTIAEIGAGSGLLAFDLLNAFKFDPDFKNFRYIIVEKSTYLKERQAVTLTSFKEKVTWKSIEDLIKSPVKGVILQNEVIDAFPVHRVVRYKEGLKEIYVDYGDNFFEVEADTSDPRLEIYLGRYGADLLPGQKGEINLEAIDWMERLCGALDDGFIITIDYGGTADELYSPARPEGTLTCYYRHQLSDNPYVNIGKQDITAHVNFSALIRRGNELGMEEAEFTTQANFLISHGLIEKVEEIERSDITGKEKLKIRLAVKNLIMPGAMGERFRVLIQRFTSGR